MPKVTKAQGSNSQTYSSIDLFSGTNIPKKIEAKVSKEVGEFLVDKINEHLSKANTPISGGSYKRRLSPEYAKYKRSTGAAGVANLELTGAMRDAIDYQQTKSGIKIGVFGNEAGKAEGHNQLSGSTPLPRRQFLPEAGQSFKRDIVNGINEIIAKEQIKKAAISKDELSGLKTKTSFNELLKEKFPGMSRSTIERAILGSPDLVDELGELGLLQWLKS